MIGRGIKKLSLSQNVELHLKFLENNTEALVILKCLSSSRMTEQIEFCGAA